MQAFSGSIDLDFEAVVCGKGRMLADKLLP